MDNYDYLREGFDPASLTNSQLRKIFVFHEIDFPSSAKKPELINVFIKEIVPCASDLIAEYTGVQPQDTGIVNASPPDKKRGKRESTSEMEIDIAPEDESTVLSSSSSSDSEMAVSDSDYDISDSEGDNEVSPEKDVSDSEYESEQRKPSTVKKSKSNSQNKRRFQSPEAEPLLTTDFKNFSSQESHPALSFSASDDVNLGSSTMPKKKGRKTLSKPFVEPTVDSAAAPEIEHYGLTPVMALSTHETKKKLNNNTDNDISDAPNTDDIRVDLTKTSAAASTIASLSAPVPVALPVHTPSKTPRAQTLDAIPSSSPFSSNNLFQSGSVSSSSKRGNSRRPISAPEEVAVGKAQPVPVTPIVSTTTTNATKRNKRSLPDDNDDEAMSPPKKRLEVDKSEREQLTSMSTSTKKIATNLFPAFTSEANYSDSDFETPQGKKIIYDLNSSPLKGPGGVGLVASSPIRHRQPIPAPALSLTSLSTLEPSLSSPNYSTPRNRPIERYNPQLEGYDSSPIKPSFNEYASDSYQSRSRQLSGKNDMVFSTLSEESAVVDDEEKSSSSTIPESEAGLIDLTVRDDQDELAAVEIPEIKNSRSWIKTIGKFIYDFIKFIIQVVLATITFGLILSLVVFASWYIEEQKRVGWCDQPGVTTTTTRSLSSTGGIEYTNFNYQIFDYDIDQLIHDARVYVQPQCLECPENAICTPGSLPSSSSLTFDQAVCRDGYNKEFPILSLNGNLPWPRFRCVPDYERASKLEELKEFVTEVLRQRKAEFECGWRDYQNLFIDSTHPMTSSSLFSSSHDVNNVVLSTSSPSSSSSSAKPKRKYISLDAGISEADLFQATLEVTKDEEVADLYKLWDSLMDKIEEDSEFIITGHNDIRLQLAHNNSVKEEAVQAHAGLAETNQENYNGDNDGTNGLAINQTRFLNNRRNRRIESLSMSRANLNCRIRYYIRQRFQIYRFEICLIVTLLVTLAALNFYFKRRQDKRDRQRAYLEEIFTHLKNQQIKSDSMESRNGRLPPYLPSNQLRELVLRGIKDVKARKVIWNDLTKEVERNTNVRSRQIEVHGDITRVWEWIGINHHLHPMVGGSGHRVMSEVSPKVN